MYQELLETASDFEELLSKLNAEKIKSNEFERRKAIFETSKIFLHDIQSPITAISSVLSIFPSNNENFSLINLALKRLKEIVEKQKQIEFYNKDFDVNVCPIFECIESVFKEKKMEYHSKGVEFKLNKNISDEVFSKVDYSMFKRIISNILNNAIEALDKDFKLIEVFVDKIDKLIVIKITDNGKGISGEIINKVMSKDFTFGKKNGSGIGLYYAQTNLKSWNGNISISSKINSGTCVTVTLLEEPEVEIQGVK